jgi:hypothetical protein
MIAIAVAAGTLVYVWSMGLVGTMSQQQQQVPKQTLEIRDKIITNIAKEFDDAKFTVVRGAVTGVIENTFATIDKGKNQGKLYEWSETREIIQSFIREVRNSNGTGLIVIHKDIYGEGWFTIYGQVMIRGTQVYKVLTVDTESIKLS